MKIAIMTAWNTEDSSAIHSRALVDEWMKLGHKVTVFSFFQEDYKSQEFTGKDGREVVRCFSRDGFFDPRPILTTDFDLFIVENLSTLPMDELAKIYPLIKSRSRTVHIVYENKLPSEVEFYQFLWDKVVYYDNRQEFLISVYPDARFIPFPCFSVRRGNKQESRDRLNLPQDKKIIFTFCQKGYQPFITDLQGTLKDKAVLLFVTSIGNGMLIDNRLIIREEGAISREALDEYLFASDVAIFHKLHSRYHNVVSSMIFQVIGADCPIFVPRQSEFFQPLKDEVVHYSDLDDLNNKLIKILSSPDEIDRIREAAEVFVQMNSADKIAKLYIDLFIEILRNSR